VSSSRISIAKSYLAWLSRVALRRTDAIAVIEQQKSSSNRIALVIFDEIAQYQKYDI